LFLQGIKIPTISIHKFLGVFLDQELCWKDLINYTLQKGAKWLMQYCRLSKPSRGVSAIYMRWFYITVAVPRLLYAADLFLIPESANGKVMKGYIAKLGKIQRQASLHIMGEMRSTPTDIIDACADLLPFHLLVSKVLHHMATRLATLPQMHPLGKHVSKVANRYVKRHRAPLHKITHAYGIWPANFKTINPVRFGPEWGLSFPVEIPESRVAAIEAAQVVQADVKVFSDGLGIDSNISAATMLYKNGEVKSTREHWVNICWTGFMSRW